MALATNWPMAATAKTARHLLFLRFSHLLIQKFKLFQLKKEREIEFTIEWKRRQRPC